MQDLDLLTIGDISIDIYMKVDVTDLLGTSSDASKICFPHGTKIPVSKEQSSIAGNSLNVAVATTKLGLRTALYAETGNDEHYLRIKKELNDLGVDTNLVHPNENNETDIHPIIIWGGDRTIFSYHSNRTYSVKDWGAPSWIYYTSMCEGFEKFQNDLIDFCNKNSNIGVAFSPGTFHMKQGFESQKNILEITDILFLNKEEAKKLVSQATKKTLNEKVEISTLHSELQKLGPKLTVITDGSRGASAFDGSVLEQIEAYKTDKPIVDKTGAGDSFAGAFLSAIHYKKSLKEALIWGTKDSAANISEVGSISGLLTRKDME